MPDALPAVSILLSSKDRRDLLRQAVASLRGLDYPRELVEIVIVEETDQPEDPGADCYVILEREGKGFAWSRNAALKAASHPLVAFTDDDCLVDREWLRELVAPFEDPDVAAVAGGVLAQPSGILGKTEIVLGFPGGGLRRIAKAGRARWMPTRELSTVNAAARLDQLLAMGGFREETGVYGGEDSELFGRLTEHHRAVFNPRALVFHGARDSLGGIARWLFRRGIADVSLAHLDRRRRRTLLVRHFRNSVLVRFGALVTALVLAGIPLTVPLLLLGLLYYTLMIARYRFARRAMGWPVLLLTPFTKLVMDTCFDVGRLKGFALWLAGKLGTKPPSQALAEPSSFQRAPATAGGRPPARVLLIENSGSFLGGGQVSFLQLIEQLDRSRFEPSVVCPDKGDFFEAVVERGVPTFVLPMPSLRGLGWVSCPFAARSWLELMRRQSIDLLHANGSRAMIYAGLSGRLASRPVLWHVRVLGSDGILDRLLARLSSRVVVNSGAVAERFDFLERKNGGRGPVVVPNGVDLRSFAEARPDPALSKAWRLKGEHVLVVLAQLIPWKRQEVAIEMLAVMRQRGLNVALILVGDEVPSSRGYRARLEEKVRQLGVDGHCVFAGFRRDVRAILKTADLLIHTATPEPFGRALIEAMASGLPLVAAAGGGVEEVVEDGVTGRIVRGDEPSRWADVVSELLRNAPLREEMGLAGRRRAEAHFSMTTHAERVQQLYAELLSR